MSRVVGIDPGVDGAIALVQDKKPPEVWDLEAASIGTVRQLVPQMIVDMLAAWGEVDLVVVEDNRALGSNGSLANWSMGVSMGIVFGVCAAMNRPILRVKPKEWQAELGLSQVKHVDRKNAHRQRAREMWPSLDDSLKLVKHHDRADALMIAEYGRRLLS